MQELYMKSNKIMVFIIILLIFIMILFLFLALKMKDFLGLSIGRIGMKLLLSPL